MDKLSCRVVYVNRNIDKDGLVRKQDLDISTATTSTPSPPASPSVKTVTDDVQPLLNIFDQVHVVSTGAACLDAVFDSQEVALYNIQPTIVLIDTPFDAKIPDSSSSAATPAGVAPTAEAFGIHTPDDNLYGLALLQKVITESNLRSVTKLVIPVPVISGTPSPAAAPVATSTDGAADRSSRSPFMGHRSLIRRCLDLGAVEVIISPVNNKCTATLEICAYKAMRDAARDQQALREITAGRKRSWVGVTVVKEQKPYSYLREAMVSGLMSGICRGEQDDEQISTAHISVSSERQEQIALAVGRWHFCAHSFGDDELLVAAMLMFQHALQMPELAPWYISTDQLIRFLVACRSAYNSFVPYHNFRHVVDVLQATFSFLVHIGALPPYSEAHLSLPTEKSPVASLLSPFDALTLLITAIGHDVGHPGVNNGFLTTLNAPLAQLYNDRSVLEAFHCAAYSQILRRYWPAAFEDRQMRSLMISSILATDMGLHFDYMKKLGDLQEKLQHNNTSEGWNGRQLEDYRTLACSLIIKCADISNVARQHDTALKWMYILSDEFMRQASMEEELDIKTSLMIQPKKDILSLGTAQLGFMNMFAVPLFQGVADIMPGMKYVVDELEINKSLFEMKVQDAKASLGPEILGLQRGMREGTMSPRTTSFIADKTATSTPTAEVDAQLNGHSQNSDSDGVHSTPDTVRESIPDSETLTNAPSASTVVVQSPIESSHLLSADRKEIYFIRGSSSSFDAVRELADSDPFNTRGRGDSTTDKSMPSGGRQRCSETTDGSVSGAYGGDWASQATSGTGKVAHSPSTQGTSVVSNDEMDRTAGVSPLEMSPPSTKSGLLPGSYLEPTTSEDMSSGTGSIGKAEGKTLKKRPSRFRIKEFPFFRRSKGTSPPFPAADMTH